ncbi:hypothetical protein REPUB_Repub01dG0134400 [Reevesia pubescens]
MFIMTNQLRKIDEVIILKCGGESYQVRVTEIGDDLISLFHCCHDSYKSKVTDKEDLLVCRSSSGECTEDNQISNSEENKVEIGDEMDTKHQDREDSLLRNEMMIDAGTNPIGEGKRNASKKVVGVIRPFESSNELDRVGIDENYGDISKSNNCPLGPPLSLLNMELGCEQQEVEKLENRLGNAGYNETLGESVEKDLGLEQELDVKAIVETHSLQKIRRKF